jgi:predicted alpha/beta superfamily hydrolase
LKLLPDRPQLAPSVAMQDMTFYSAALQRQMVYRIFLPEKIAPSQRLPVVYLLHGNGGDYRNWSNWSDVARYAAPSGASEGLILVMVDGGSSYFMNAVEKPEDRYEDYSEARSKSMNCDPYSTTFRLVSASASELPPTQIL